MPSCPSRYVPCRFLLLSLPPSCHRTRSKDAKTRPHRPGPTKSFLAFLSGEGGIRTPGTVCTAQRFSRPPHSLPGIPPLISTKLRLAGLFRESSTARDLIQGATWAHLGVQMAQEWHKRTAESVADRAFPGAGPEARVVAVSEADGQSATTHTMARWPAALSTSGLSRAGFLALQGQDLQAPFRLVTL